MLIASCTVDKLLLQIHTVVSQPFDENSYVVHASPGSSCLIIDPGFEPEKIADYLHTHRLLPAAILNTHGHGDHIAGNADMKARWPDCPLIIGQRDAEKLTNAAKNLTASFGLPLTSPAADRTVTEEDSLRLAGIPLEVFEVPGHSCGHVVFLCQACDPWILFGGDVLFRGSIGRTDFPDGSFERLAAAIHSKIFTLPDQTVVYPGHGPPTTVGWEKAGNPFVGRPAGYRG
jgi:glyoxylase-like metal-dependent hydrolase (beta-lactamase superfamily II)